MIPLGISLYSPPFLMCTGKTDSPNKKLKDYSIQSLRVAVCLRIVPQTIKPLSHAEWYESRRRR